MENNYVTLVNEIEKNFDDTIKINLENERLVEKIKTNLVEMSGLIEQTVNNQIKTFEILDSLKEKAKNDN